MSILSGIGPSNPAPRRWHRLGAFRRTVAARLSTQGANGMKVILGRPVREMALGITLWVGRTGWLPFHLRLRALLYVAYHLKRELDEMTEKVAEMQQRIVDQQTEPRRMMLDSPSYNVIQCE